MQVYFRDLCFHEAGHAGVAVHVRVRVRYTRVTRKSQLNDKDEAGFTSLDLGFKAFSWNKAKNALVAVTPEKLRDHARRVITVLYAGKAAEAVFGTRGDMGGSDKRDLNFIRKLQGKHSISDGELPRLENRAERIATIPWIQNAIRDVAFELERKREVSGRRIRETYNWWKKSHRID